MSFSHELFLREDGLVASIDYKRFDQNEHQTPLVQELQAVAPVRYITHDFLGNRALHAVTDDGRWFEYGRGTLKEHKVLDTRGHPEKIAMVAASVVSGAALTESGSVYVYSTIGDGGSAVPDQRRQYERMAPESFDNARIVLLACHDGGSFLAVSDVGGVYMWGCFTAGVLPFLDPDPDFFTVRKVDPATYGDERVEFVAMCGNEACVVTESGRCIFWQGDNMFSAWPSGGDESVFLRVGPEDLDGEKPVMVSMNTEKYLVVTAQGSLWLMGKCDKAHYERLDFVLYLESFVRLPRDMLGGAAVTLAHAAQKETIVTTTDGSVWSIVSHSTGSYRQPGTCTAHCVYSPGVGGVRAGRFVRDEERELTVCMSAHERIGKESGLQALSGEPALLRLIAQAGVGAGAGWPLDVRQKSTWALARLMGGGALLKSPET